MDRLVAWIREIPPITRYWLAAIITTSLLTKLKLVSKVSLVFVPEKAFGPQPWRLITPFCFFNDLSYELLINVWFILRSSRVFEAEFLTRSELFPSSFRSLNERQQKVLQDYIDRNKSLDYLWFVIQICASTLLAVTYGYYRFGFKFLTLGAIMDDILWYMWCKENPNIEVNIFWLTNIRTAYLPWCYTAINLIVFSGFSQNIFAILSGDFSQRLSFDKKAQLWKVIVSYTSAHLWWFARDVLLAKIYHDKNAERRKLRQSTFEHYKVNRPNVMREVVACLLLPPWYWAIGSKIRRMVR